MTSSFREETGEKLSPAKVNMKAATLLRRFVLGDLFKLDDGELR